MELPASLPGAPPGASDDAVLDLVQALLKAPDDTKRFVGLALLKPLLDNAPALRHDEARIATLWAGISSRFLDRLLRTGSNPAHDNAKEMLDLVVSVLQTFAALLPNGATSEPRFVAMVPGLVAAALHSSAETTTQLLQLLHILVSNEQGATAFSALDDLSPLTEMAPSHQEVLDIIRHAWLNSMAFVDDRAALRCRVDKTLLSLASSFKGTDAVTFLAFLGHFLRQAFSAIVPEDPKWLPAAVGYIRSLVTSRPTSEARSAYTEAAAALLQVYPLQAPPLLFTDPREANRDTFAYLFVNLLLVDIRASLPSLLTTLNSPEYPAMASRLSSSFNIISIFVGFLVRSLEEEEEERPEPLVMAPESLLKLRKAISETMSVTVEYLRDRWDASVAGAMGLHPDARARKAQTSMGSWRTLTWDSFTDRAHEDPLILAAVRALALWLREDENHRLRREATGLVDMFADLYRSSDPDKLDFRAPVLVALEALVTLHQGCELLLGQGMWDTLSKDLVSVFHDAAPGPEEASRGLEIVRVLLSIVEQETSGTQEEWMGLITTVAAWPAVVCEPAPPFVRELRVAVLTLCCALLSAAGTGMRRRYVHSIGAIRGVAQQLSQTIPHGHAQRDAMTDALDCLDDLGRCL